MKTLGFAIATTLLFSVLAFAQKGSGPCAPFIETCKSKGFHWGDHKMAGCVRGAASGNQACLAAIKAHRQEWEAKHGGGGAPAAAPAEGSGAPPAAGN